MKITEALVEGPQRRSRDPACTKRVYANNSIVENDFHIVFGLFSGSLCYGMALSLINLPIKPIF